MTTRYTAHTTNLPAGYYDRGVELTEAQLLQRLNEQDAEVGQLRAQVASAHEHVGALCSAIEHEQSALDTYDVTRGEAAEDALEVARVNARSARNAARAWLRRAAQ